MSNPGVLTLSQITITEKKKFRVEDNLGESIHLHYNDIRVDLSVRELLYLGEEADRVILDRVKAEGFDLSLFPGDSFLFISPYLLDLRKVETVTLPADSLRAETRNALKFPVLRKLDRIPEGKEKKPVIVFNDEMVIRYGADHAAALYRKEPKANMEVLRLTFSDNQYSYPSCLWFSFIKKKIKRRLKRLFA